MAPSRSLWLAGLIAIFCLLGARATAADKLLPGDTEFFLTINVKQLLDSPLVKKRGVPAAKEALKSAGEATEILESLGFDPFSDLDRITFAGPGGSEHDRGLVIVRGRFDLDKFKDRAAKAAEDEPDVLKIRKLAGKVVYEVALPDQDAPFFVTFLNKTTLVASPGKDYIMEAIKKDASKEKSGIKDKDFNAVLERIDVNQSLVFAAVGSAFKGADLGPAKELAEKVDAVAGGLTVGDEIKFEVVLSAKTEDDAKTIKETANKGINSGIALLGIVAGDHKEIDKVLDILKTVKATAKDKTVTLKARIEADILKGMFDKEE